MLGTVYTKTIRDRSVGYLIGAGSVVAMAIFGISVYADLGNVMNDVFASMPEAFLSTLGISPTGGATSIVLGEMVNFIAPLVLSALAIMVGTSAIAGEERDGTLGLLLANPRSRTSLLASKTGAMVSLVALAGGLVGAGMLAALALAGASTDGIHIVGAMTHVVAAALFFGALSLFIGSWTGNSVLATGASVGVMIVSFLAAGLLPLVSGLENLARIFPWYYINSTEPLRNGLDWGQVAILVVGTLVLMGGAIVGVNRRDLKSGEGTATLADRLRNYPRVAKVAERVAGRVQVSNIGVKTLSDSQAITVVGAMAIFYMAVLMGPMFNGMSGALSEMSASIPESLLVMIGSVDMSTPAGWYWGEIFSIVVPAAIIAVTAMMGVRALAGEEGSRTMGLLVANPIPRSKVVIEKAGAMVVVGLLLGIAAFLGTIIGALVGGLDLGFFNVAAASLQGAALGIFIGSVALLAGALTGDTKVAAYAASGVALVSWVVNAFLPLSATLAGWVRISPFYYYAGNQPLTDGLSVGNLAVLTAGSIVLVLAAVFFFERRDLRG